MDKIYNVALVGCGNIAPNHIRALLQLPNVRIVALCDKNAEKAEKRKAEFSLDSKIYTDYENMLNLEKLDSVHIATPHYLHAEMVISALLRNINVFLEKPVAISFSEIERMKEAEKSSKASVCVCFQNRFNPSTKIAKRIVEEDGGAKSGFACVFWFRNESYYTDSGWRGKYATEGGGVMINQAIHTIDLLCEFLGKPESVIATTANHHLKEVIEVEDTCEGIIKFENGNRANFHATTSFVGRDTTLLCFVTEKKRKVQIQDSAVYVDGIRVEDPSLVSDFFGKECYGNGHMYLIRKFYKALSEGAPMPVTLDSAESALKILLTAYKSNDIETKID